MNQEEILEVTKALSDPTRYQILRRIPERGTMCCSDLAECFGVSKATVTHHINILCDLELVHGEKHKTFHLLTRNQQKLELYVRALKRQLEL